METEIQAWHFVGKTLRDGRPIPADGEWLVHAGEITICEMGLHASERALDALQYAPGMTVCRVTCRGIVEQHADKFVCRERRIDWHLDATEVLRAFSRKAALSVIDLWEAPDIVRQYLETGDEELRPAADAVADAAYAVADAAYADAADAAYAARAVAGAAYAAEAAADAAYAADAAEAAADAARAAYAAEAAADAARAARAAARAVAGAAYAADAAAYAARAADAARAAYAVADAARAASYAARAAYAVADAAYADAAKWAELNTMLEQMIIEAHEKED